MVSAMCGLSKTMTPWVASLRLWLPVRRRSEPACCIAPGRHNVRPGLGLRNPVRADLSLFSIVGSPSEHIFLWRSFGLSLSGESRIYESFEAQCYEGLAWIIHEVFSQKRKDA